MINADLFAVMHLFGGGMGSGRWVGQAGSLSVGNRGKVFTVRVNYIQVDHGFDVSGDDFATNIR